MNDIIKKARKKDIEIIAKIIIIYIICQPILDILSRLNIKGYIPGISTILKPLVVFGLGLYIIITNFKKCKKYVVIYICYAIFLIAHCILLKNINIENSVIFHEIRFMINIIYMIVLYMIINKTYEFIGNKKEFIKGLKYSLIVGFSIYVFLFLIAVLTGTSGATYEYSDSAKLGFKGWLDSGQIFGHALCIILPFLIYSLLNNKVQKKFIKILLKISVVLPIITLLLIGTKVTYYIAVLVLFINAILEFIYFLKNKNKEHLINILICMILVSLSIVFYRYSPVKKNTDINNHVLSSDISQFRSSIENDRESVNLDQNVDKTSKMYSEIKYYNSLSSKALEKLEEFYEGGKVHPANLRKKQLIYNMEKYKVANLKYKLLGLGYLNQPSNLSIERDILMILFNLGIIGFLLILLIPIKIFINATKKILMNIKNIDFEFLALYEGFGIFYCISLFAGYTFIYTNFSIFLTVLMVLIIDKLYEHKDKRFNKYFSKLQRSKKNFYDEIKNDLINEEKKFIVTANPETLMVSEKDEKFKKAILDKNTIIIPDGIGILKGAKILGYDIKETIPGVELCSKLFELCNEYNKKIFLFGAKEEVVKRLKEVIEKEFPNAIISGYQNGYIEDKQKEFENISKLNPDIILVALGIPQQELLIYKNLDKFKKGIFVGVGGSFDVLSGTKKRAPKIFIKLHLEWLYRITTEPKRLKRFFKSNIKYIIELKKEGEK